MKPLAGALLLVMCLINGIAGLGYLLGGAFASIFGEAVTEVAKEEGKESQKQTAAAAKASSSEEAEHDEELAKKQAENAKNLDEAGKDAKKVGAGLTAFGAFLVLLAIGQIVVAIMFFAKSQSARIIGIVIGACGIAAEGISIAITNLGVTNILGIIVGGLAIAAALVKPPVPPAPAYGYPPGYPPGGGPGYPPGPPYGG